jgi:1-deoxy-D-xylulose-5-phosphate reductoisomerase
MAKIISILGATGSIGKQALEAVDEMGDINIIALTAHSQIDILYKQILKYKPKLVCVVDEALGYELYKRVSDKSIEFAFGASGIEMAASLSEADIVLNSVVGSAGLLPTVKAIEAGKTIAFANKETLVCAGKMIMDMAKKHNARLIPVDSEHSAIFQCLQGNEGNKPEKLFLTASGGPFRLTPKEELVNIKAQDALKHPNWSMGKKITIDSATLMNKGLEVIEAKWLFNMDFEDIQVLVHPQSIIHSMVGFEDGAVIAQLGTPDMRLPIAYAFSYPERSKLGFKKLDFFELNALTFEKPRYEDFPCLNLAVEAAKTGGTMPACMNAANEIAVSKFLNGEIGFTQIPAIIEKVMAAYTYVNDYKLEDVLNADAFGRSKALEVI